MTSSTRNPLEGSHEQLGHEIDLSGVDFDYLDHHQQPTASPQPGGDVPLQPAKEAGKGAAHKPEMVPLDVVIEKINDLFDGDHPESSVRSVIAHVKERLEESETLQQQVNSNTVETTMGAALRQRCLIHRARNILAKVAKNAQADLKADYWAIFDLAADVEPGIEAVKLALNRIDAFAKRWRDSYPGAVRALLDDRGPRSCIRVRATTRPGTRGLHGGGRELRLGAG